VAQISLFKRRTVERRARPRPQAIRRRDLVCADPGPPPSLGPLAIALVTHQSRPDLERFLDRQLAVARALGAPMIAVDNGSTDGSADLLASAAGDSPLRVLDMGRNAGYAAGVNAAFAALPGRDVLLLNPDVDPVGAHTVRALATLLARHPSLGIAAPRLVGEDGSFQASARRTPSLGALLGGLPRVGGLGPLRRSRIRYEEPSRAERATVVDWVVGAAMLIRRAAFDAVGGWDERFFLYCEDVDFCRRCALAGWETAYVPEVTVTHLFHAQSRRGPRTAAAAFARRRHYASHARLFADDPRLLFGGGRGSDRPLRLAAGGS
jgi:N-acetylglucosaminyl-diphospho-decaprenol L-rhamnosyltransferase